MPEEGSPAPADETSRFIGIDLGVNCVVASSKAGDRYAVDIDTNDVSGRSTPATVSYDGKLRHVGVAADGRAMSAPKQTLTHLSLTLGGAAQTRRRQARYWWGFKIEDDGRLGPVSYDGEEFCVARCGPLSALLRTLAGYAQSSPCAEKICIAVPDALDKDEIECVWAALWICGLEKASLLRHSDAVITAFVQGAIGELLAEGVASRTVAFVDIGVSHGTVSVVKYARPKTEDGENLAATSDVVAEVLYQRSEETMGVQALIAALVGEAKTRIEAKHKCSVNMTSKAGLRIAAESVHMMKQLSMSPDADFNLEALMPEGPDGPEIDVTLKFTRDALEAAAASTLTLLREVLTEAIATTDSIEAVELIGGGMRVPAIQTLVKEAAGESIPLRYGLDGASCVATGAAAWAAGRRPVLAVEVSDDQIREGDTYELLNKIKDKEVKIDAIHAEEVARLDKRNTLESYVYKVRGWVDGKDGKLLNPEVLNPFLDKVQLWFEDAEYAEEPTSLQVYSEKLIEVEEFVKKEGAAFFEKQTKEREEQEKALAEETAQEAARRKELGMDFDKDERVMKKEDRLKLAGKNKDEGNDMFKAQKFDDAIRRYKKAIEHVCRPELVSNLTPDEAEEARKLKVSCHLNSAQCYIKAADTAFAQSGKNGAEPFYKKAKTSCDDVLSLDEENIKALFRRSTCWEKLGECESAMKDVKKALLKDPENADLKKSQARIEKLFQKQKDGQKKVYSKMFG